VGSRVGGRYTLGATLGEGGTAQVYRAFDAVLKREVALKVLTAGLGVPDWLVHEAEIMAALRHPNIVQVHDVGEHQGTAYLTMDLIEGEPLTTPAKDARHAVDLTLSIARAVHFAHQHGVLHRDLKPANVLIDRETGQAFVSDFGHATRTELAGQAKPGGTPDYMAPEAWKGEPASVAADVWSAGMVLYKLLMGRRPFEAKTLEELQRRVLEDAPAPLLGVHPDLAAVCRCCLEKDPARRYPSAGALAEDLSAFLDGREVRARPLGVVERWRRRAARHPVISGLAALVFAAVIFAVASTVRAVRAQHEADLAALRVTSLAGAHARELAQRVSERFERYRDAVERAGHLPEVLRAAADPALASRACEALVNRPVTGAARDFDAWLLFDAGGMLLGRAPKGTRNNERRDYSWRDYFRGARDEEKKGHRRPYVSRVYVSEGDGAYQVGVSSLLYGDGDRVVGLLVAELRSGSAFGDFALGDAPLEGVTEELLARRDRDRDVDTTYADPVSILRRDLPSGTAEPTPADVLLGGRLGDGALAHVFLVKDTPFTVLVREAPRR
jgi:hypothetical protein